MTIDERIEHLNRSIADLKAEHDERFQRLDERLGAIAESLEIVVDLQKANEKLSKRLGRLVIDHEMRIWELEGGDEDKAESEPQ